MKKAILFILLNTPIFCFCQSNSEPIMTVKMGLIAELMSVKMNAETGVSMVLSDTLNLINPKDKNEILEDYNRLRVMSIPLIAQLITDISKNNSLKTYNKLDGLLTEKSIQDININDVPDSKIKTYIENFKLLDRKLRDFYTKAYNISHIKGGSPRFPLVTDIVAIFTAIETAVKDFNDAKGKKVDKLVTILDATKLAAPNDLMGGGKDKKKAEGKQ